MLHRRRSERLEETRIEFEKDLKKYTHIAHQRGILFEGLRRGNVCKLCLCYDDRVLVKCSGGCGDHVHEKCAQTTNAENEVKCHECFSDVSAHTCYACKDKYSEATVRCSVETCGRYYHTKCLDDWLQTKALAFGKVTCPSHVCYTCVADDPQNRHFSFKDSQLTRCIKCPSTYHSDSKCIPAGTQFLTVNQHICIRHRKKCTPPHLNWCYICGRSGDEFLYCDSCPLVSHSECLQTKVVGETSICDSCEKGRHPLYGETVWAKFHHYQWWPAVIVPPACIPSSLADIERDDHDICVRFFDGKYEFRWLARSFVYLYEYGDDAQGVAEAVRQAEKWHKTVLFNVEKTGEATPLQYTQITKIKQLAPAKFDYIAVVCKCRPDDVNPCGPSSTCSNRECWTECDASLCPAGAKCQNQCIEKRVYAKVTRKHFGDMEFGLIADANICAGILVIEYIGELVTEMEFQRRLKSKQGRNSYFMRYGKGLYIDAEHRRNMSRLLNHSCNPNCEPRVVIVNGLERIGIFAKKDIEKGDELTFSYEYGHETPRCLGAVGRKIGGKIGG